MIFSLPKLFFLIDIKHKRVQSITDIKALETICGPLASRRPAQDKWDNIEGEDPDDEDGYSARRMHIQVRAFHHLRYEQGVIWLSSRRKLFLPLRLIFPL